MRVYNEVGVGLDWLICHEVEYDDGKEVRYKGWWVGSIKRVYGRIWVGKKVLVISSNGLEVVKKRYNSFKVVLGFEMSR